MAAALGIGHHQVVAVDPRIAAAARGDRAAAESLLGELLPRVRNLVRYLVRGDGEVDDITQQALIAIAKGWASFRGEGAFERWADRITTRETFAQLKRARGERGRRRENAPELVSLSPATPAPDELYARRRAVRLLDQLPLEQRQVIVLHHVVGLSVPELSSELGVPAETARSRLRLGIARLRALHAEEVG